MVSSSSWLSNFGLIPGNSNSISTTITDVEYNLLQIDTNSNDYLLITSINA